MNDSFTLVGFFLLERDRLRHTGSGSGISGGAKDQAGSDFAAVYGPGGLGNSFSRGFGQAIRLGAGR